LHPFFPNRIPQHSWFFWPSQSDQTFTFVRLAPFSGQLLVLPSQKIQTT
jgi:hypothetical protein